MPKWNILVADDDAAIRTVLNQALSRAGYEVRSTSNAATLWRWVAEGEGDLIITDVVMPEMTGPEFVRAISAEHGHIPVLYLTGYVGDAGDAGDLAGQHILRKPFTIAALAAAVTRSLGGGTPSGSPAAEPAVAAE